VSHRALIVYADGAARGNPGPAAGGAVLVAPDGAVIDELNCALGRATNNVAEYRALILGLTAAAHHGAEEVTVRMDSELVVRQMDGRYRVKNEALKVLYEEASALARKFKRFAIEHVPRDMNTEADRLANAALDDA
jgi:ribonuclease HI